MDEVTSQIGVVESYTIDEKRYYGLNTSAESISACTDYFSSYYAGGDVEEYIDFCTGNDYFNDETIFHAFRDVDNYWWVKYDLVNLNVFTPITLLDSDNLEVRILDYDVDTCGIDVSIPSYIDGIPVTTVGCADEECYYEYGDNEEVPYAFRYLNISTVKLPNTIKYIGEDAFQGNELTNVVIPNSVVSIGSHALSYNYLTDLTIPNSVVSIGKAAFSYNDLTDFTLPSHFTSIPDRLYGGNNITKLEIPNYIVSIGAWAFASNGIIDLTIPSSVVSIGANAFQSNNITDLTIPSSVESIGYRAFATNPHVNVNIQGNPTIGNYAFGTISSSNFQIFSYGGTCDELNSYTDIFNSNYKPQTIITSDSNSCSY